MNFAAAIKDFIFSRQERLLPSQLSKEYVKSREEVKEHYAAIQDKLAPEFYKYLMALENAHSSMEAEAMEVSYRQGFSDGVRIIAQALAKNDMGGIQV